ncbi:MAG: transposase [Candidatus Borkfalkiaceae bacterium]|nr:transposase [Christensenellaceae bacterium]
MDLKKRKNLRLKEYNYSSSGAYFVTICTDNRKNTLCSIKNVKEKAEIVLSEYGKIADNVICRIEEKFDIKLNCYVIMPNHIHLVIIIDDESPEKGMNIR